jgi:hypothetical protein
LMVFFFHSALRGCAVLFAPYIATRSESVIFQSPPVGRHRPLLLFLLLSLVVRLCIFNVFLQFYKFNTFCSSFSAFEKNLTCIDLCSEWFFKNIFSREVELPFENVKNNARQKRLWPQV